MRDSISDNSYSANVTGNWVTVSPVIFSSRGLENENCFLRSRKMPLKKVRAAGKEEEEDQEEAKDHEAVQVDKVLDDPKGGGERGKEDGGKGEKAVEEQVNLFLDFFTAGTVIS